MHHATSTHRLGVLSPPSGVDADAGTGGLSPKLATPPGSPPRLHIPLSRSGLRDFITREILIKCLLCAGHPGGSEGVNGCAQ